MTVVNERPPSFFKVTRYLYARQSGRFVHYPSFRLNSDCSTFFSTLAEAEAYVARKGMSYAPDYTCLGAYAYIITELPLGIDISLY